MSLFPESQPPKPLAERLRPKSLDQVLGQSEVCSILNAYIDQGSMPSVVFWGPPGCGKTTLSRLMAMLLGWEGRSLNATSASVKDIRDIAAEAKVLWTQWEKRTLLFIDEIHRLNKAQQDVLLPFVEAGSLVLAGSTTENPYFSVIGALRSRVQLLQLHPLSPQDVEDGLRRAAQVESVALSDDACSWIALRSAGDIRLALTVLESASLLAKSRGEEIQVSDAALCLKSVNVSAGSKEDNHYDLASAYQKSLRGSDANAALYYLGRFLSSGEDPRFIARRLLVTASEDVGNADPRALEIALSAYKAVDFLGLPEGRIPLAQATLYVAQAPKSNEAITAIDAVSELLRTRALDPIPLHLRDSHYAGASELGHGKDYVYTHQNPEQPQAFLPEALKNHTFILKPSPKKPDTATRELLLQHLKEKTEEEWFSIEAEELSTKSQIPVTKVRAALNELVQDGVLEFRRIFRWCKPK